MLCILDQVFVNQKVSPHQSTERFHTSPQSAIQALHRLKALGILIEATGKKTIALITRLKSHTIAITRDLHLNFYSTFPTE